MSWGIFKRKPDFTIYRDGDAYMYRWYILPRNRLFNIYLHNTVQDDDPVALHDHPWWNVSIVLKGGYFEVMPNDPMGPEEVVQWANEVNRHYSAHLREMKATRYQADKCHKVWRGPGSIVFRRALDAHRLGLKHVVVSWSDPVIGDVKRRQYRTVTTPSWSLFITGPNRRKWGFWCKQGWTPFDQYIKKTADGNDKGAGCG